MTLGWIALSLLTGYITGYKKAKALHEDQRDYFRGFKAGVKYAISKHEEDR